MAEQKAQEVAAANKAAAAAKKKAQEEAAAKKAAEAAAAAAKKAAEAAAAAKKAKEAAAAAAKKAEKEAAAKKKAKEVAAAAKHAQAAAPTRTRFVPPDRRMRSAATQPLPTGLRLFCLRPLLRLRLDHSVLYAYLSPFLVVFWHHVCAVFLLTLVVCSSLVRVLPPRKCVRIFCQLIYSLCLFVSSFHIVYLQRFADLL